MKIRLIKTFFTIALGGVVLASCGSITTQHGNVIDPIALGRVEPGKTRLVEVESLFGRPSAQGAFDSGKIYYVSQLMEEKPGGRNIPIERTVIAFSYNENGLITAVDVIDDTTGITVFHRDEKTPTPGDTFGILEQIFRNAARPGGLQ